MLSLENVLDTLRSVASDLRTLNRFEDASSLDVIADRIEDDLDAEDDD